MLGGGYGCFAAINFRKGQRIGLYHGKVTSPDFDTYKMTSEELNVTLGPEAGVGGAKLKKGGAIYFGLHFCNDANRSKFADNASKDMDPLIIPRNNVYVDEYFWVIASRNIKADEEIFMPYNDDEEEGGKDAPEE